MSGITFVLAVIDMSGSMSPLAQDVRDGFNEFINGLRADEAGAYRVTAVLFDDKYEPLCVAAPLEQVPKLTTDNYRPRGWTALYDAVGRTIDDFEKAAKVGEADRVIAFIQTDGEENVSRTYTAMQIREMLRAREITGRWDFKFVGSHADSWNQAQRMGCARANTFTVGNTSVGTRGTFRGVSAGTRAYAGGQSATASSAAFAAAVNDEQDKENNS